jgi:hypothetical protein
MPHCYQTRQKTKVHNDILQHLKKIMDGIEAASTPKIRYQEYITLCQYFTDRLDVFTHFPRLKPIMWDKMAEMEKVILADLEKLPSMLESNQTYVNDLLLKRYLLLEALTAMENLRLTYW